MGFQWKELTYSSNYVDLELREYLIHGFNGKGFTQCVEIRSVNVCKNQVNKIKKRAKRISYFF